MIGVVVAGLFGAALTASAAPASTFANPNAPANVNPDKKPVLDAAKIIPEPDVPLTKEQARTQAYEWVAADRDSRVACFNQDGTLAGLAEVDKVNPGAMAPTAAATVCQEWAASKPALDIPAVTPASHYIGHHWAHNGLARSQIYFVDHTGAKWPVATATYKWNEASGVDSYYETSCPSSQLHCVNVYEYNSNDGYFGVTYYPNTWDGAGHNRAGVYVRLNNNTVTTATQARKSTCHELGHVLGLDHRSVDSSCMRQGAAPPISSLPDTHDFDELHSIYNHAN